MDGQSQGYEEDKETWEMDWHGNCGHGITDCTNVTTTLRDFDYATPLWFARREDNSRTKRMEGDDVTRSIPKVLFGLLRITIESLVSLRIVCRIFLYCDPEEYEWEIGTCVRSSVHPY